MSAVRSGPRASATRPDGREGVARAERGMTDRVTIGIVGCGRLAEVGYLPALARVPGAARRRGRRPRPRARGRVARLVADGPGTGAVTAHHDLTELLDAGTPDALVSSPPRRATTWPTRRSRSAERSAALIEKPPASTVPPRPNRRARAAPVDHVQPSLRPGAARGLRADVDRHDAFEFEFEITYRRQGWGSVQVHYYALLDLGPHLVDWARWIAGGDLDRVRELEIRPNRAVVLARSPRGAVRLIARTDGTYRERIEVRARRPVGRARSDTAAPSTDPRPAPGRDPSPRRHARGRAHRVRRPWPAAGAAIASAPRPTVWR